MRFGFIFILFLILISCSKETNKPVVDIFGQYQYPNHVDGHVSFQHSFNNYNCDDSIYWNTIAWSKEFYAEESLFVGISEVMSPNWQRPFQNGDQQVTVTGSNGDEEVFVFDNTRPHPPCISVIDGFTLLFSGKLVTETPVLKNNGTIDLQADTLQVTVTYKSYWTGKIVQDTAYVYPSILRKSKIQRK